MDPRFALGPTLLERLRRIERRIANLEGASQQGILGTDQTIKACHDRLDGLLGPGGIASDGLTHGGQLHIPFSATAGRVEADFYKDIADNVATPLCTITTPNGGGATSAGVYSVLVHAIGYANRIYTSGLMASRDLLAAFGRSVKASDPGVNSAVTEIYKSASIDTDAGTRTVTTFTMSVAETSEFINTMSFLVDVTSGVPGVYVHIELVWSGFTTAPVIAAA